MTVNDGEKVLTFDEYSLDPERRILRRNDEQIALNSKAFELLLYLVENAGTVVSKDALLDSVWSGQFVEENNLTVQISALRKAFGEKKGDNSYIATVPGKGYKFVANVETHTETVDEIIVENRTVERIVFEHPSEPETLMLPPKRRGYVPYLIVGVVLAAAIGVFAWIKLTTATQRIESIAVMPFVNESGDADAEYLSDGMTESLINSLSRLPKLTVKARNSVFTYKGKEIDPTKVASELSVQALLLGRIVERGDTLTVRLELVDAANNNHLWGEQYERKTVDLTTLQGDIARDVANKLRSRLTDDKPIERGGTTNAEAYQLYLKGRFFWNKRNRDDHLKAKELFEQAIAIDPNFALAYAAIGDIYTVDTSPFSRSENQTGGRAMAAKALSIEPELAQAYAVLAKEEWDQYNRDKADEYFIKALDLNPNYASAHQWRGESLMQVGRNAESLAEIRRAVELDPLSDIINTDYIYLLTMDRQYDAAIEQAKRAIELDPRSGLAYLWWSVADEYKRNFEEVFPILDKSIDLAPLRDDLKALRHREVGELRDAVAADGERGYWKKVIDIEFRPAPNKPADPDYYYVAVAHAMLGEKEKAIDALETTLEQNNAGKNSNHTEQIHLMWCEPAFEALRTEPRFQELLRKIGIHPPAVNKKSRGWLSVVRKAKNRKPKTKNRECGTYHEQLSVVSGQLSEKPKAENRKPRMWYVPHFEFQISNLKFQILLLTFHLSLLAYFGNQTVQFTIRPNFTFNACLKMWYVPHSVEKW